MSVNGILQLEALTLRYCRASGASRGAREAVARHLADFARATPGAAVAARAIPSQAPRVVAAYRDGTRKEIDLKNKSAGEVAAVLARLRDLATAARRSFRKPVATRVPTVQGMWDPSITYEGFELREAKAP